MGSHKEFARRNKILASFFDNHNSTTFPHTTPSVLTMASSLLRAAAGAPAHALYRGCPGFAARVTPTPIPFLCAPLPRSFHTSAAWGQSAPRTPQNTTTSRGAWGPAGVPASSSSTAASPSPSPSSPPPPPPPKGIIAKVRFALKEYGRVAVGIYAGLWVVPFAGTYVVFAANGNFGQDPLEWVSWAVGPERMAGLLASAGLAPDTHLSPTHVSLIFAYLVSEVIETPRMAATLLLAPRAKRWLDARKAAAGAGAGAGGGLPPRL